MNKFNQKIKYSNKKLYFSVYCTNIILILTISIIAFKTNFFIKKTKTYPIYKIDTINPYTIQEEDLKNKSIFENLIKSDYLQISLTGKKMSIFKKKEVISQSFKNCQNGQVCYELKFSDNDCEDKIEKNKEFAKWCFEQILQNIVFHNLENIIINLKIKKGRVFEDLYKESLSHFDYAKNFSLSGYYLINFHSKCFYDKNCELIVDYKFEEKYDYFFVATKQINSEIKYQTISTSYFTYEFRYFKINEEFSIFNIILFICFIYSLSGFVFQFLFFIHLRFFINFKDRVNFQNFLKLKKKYLEI